MRLRIINKSAFSMIRLIAPPKIIAHAFAQAVDPLHQFIVLLERQNVKLGVMRDRLLPKLVTGQIDLSSLDLGGLIEFGGVMPGPYTEGGLVEQPALELLSELGWTVVNAFSETFGAAGTLGRDSMRDAILTHRLRDTILRLNPTVPEVIREEALAAIGKDRSLMDPVRANREVYELIRNGYRAEWQGETGGREYATVQYIDFRDPTANDLMAASQVWIAGDLYRRRVDTVLYVNGIPLVLLEFKEPNRPVKAAYDENLTDYRAAIPQLFVPNGFVLLSNGSDAKVGSTYAP